MKDILDIRPSPRLLQVLGDIPLQNWQCLAELIDNSLDELLKQSYRNAGDPLCVDISIETEQNSHTTLVVRDNGAGMTADELERSLRAGHSSKGRYGTLGLFGMGFNIATARLGDVTTVETTTRGSQELLSATINFAQLQRDETFNVPLVRTACESASSGTIVRIQLKRMVAEDLARPAAQQGIITQLGNVYSYLLRDSVPGINRSGMSSRIPAQITFNGKVVEAGLPCIWADNRKVVSAGMEVHAVEYIDKHLTPATACLSCGYWDRKNGPEYCEECGSSQLELRERRIWGWMGIQRYIDSTHYGIDFVRYGRKILTLDKTIFTYQDPDTLLSDIEYPIEMPANQGRIVGEIHLDHVPVTYQKNDFSRQSRDWQIAMQELRGSGPLKPRGAALVNNSPLSRLYSAFRRNDPGTRYLTPGDGERAIHSKAREWAQLFARGIARYQDDTEWYEAAERHQLIKTGITKVGDDTKNYTLSDNANAAQSAVAQLFGAEENRGPTIIHTEKNKSNKLTEHEILERARTLGTRRDDLSGEAKLSRGLGSWKITVITTKERIDEECSGGLTVAKPGLIVGNEIEVFVYDEHPIFREYSRDIRDAALLRVAEIIKGLTGSKISAVEIYSELIQSIPDLKMTEAVIVDRINRLFDRIRELMYTFVTRDPNLFWDSLDTQSKAAIENRAAVMMPTTRLEEIVEDGQFIKCADVDGIRLIVERHAVLLFDGHVFKPMYTGRSTQAQARLLGNIVRGLSTLNDFQLDTLMRQKHDISLASITLDYLETQLSSEEFHG